MKFGLFSEMYAAHDDRPVEPETVGDTVDLLVYAEVNGDYA